MNERIKELAEQAVLSKNFNPVVYEQWYLDAMEKFAELVIKETLQVAHGGVEYGDGMESAVYAYFGLGMTDEQKKELIKDLLGVQK